MHDYRDYLPTDTELIFNSNYKETDSSNQTEENGSDLSVESPTIVSFGRATLRENS